MVCIDRILFSNRGMYFFETTRVILLHNLMWVLDKEANVT